jgi:hypothetical protein
MEKPVLPRAIHQVYHDAIRGKIAKYEQWCDYGEEEVKSKSK